MFSLFRKKEQDNSVLLEQVYRSLREGRCVIVSQFPENSISMAAGKGILDLQLEEITKFIKKAYSYSEQMRVN